MTFQSMHIKILLCYLEDTSGVSSNKINKTKFYNLEDKPQPTLQYINICMYIYIGIHVLFLIYIYIYTLHIHVESISKVSLSYNNEKQLFKEKNNHAKNSECKWIIHITLFSNSSLECKKIYI